MGRQPVQDLQGGFAGGINQTSDPAFLRPDQTRQAVNYRLSSFGAALKRLGTVITSTSTITTSDTTSNAIGGIYWPKQAYAYVFDWLAEKLT